LHGTTTDFDGGNKVPSWGILVHNIFPTSGPGADMTPIPRFCCITTGAILVISGVMVETDIVGFELVMDRNSKIYQLLVDENGALY
jgi:hypothetical protein